MIHIRHRHDAHFTVVGNHLAQHPDLSLVAIGIGVHIQSLPDGACVGIKDLTRRFREGELVIGRALKELEDAGYLERRRVRSGDGRVSTRTRWFERPGAPPPPVDLVKRRPAPVRAPEPPARAPKRERTIVRPPSPVEPPSAKPSPAGGPVDRPAAELLAGLRRRDPRLLLSEADVRRLAPAVRTWLDRDVGPAQVTRTLTADLPVDPIVWPARLLAHRLSTWLPPALPTRPVGHRPSAAPESPGRPLPFQTCDGCERAFRAPRPGLCRDCRDGPPAAGTAA
ncbi:helix-turn-helix domain-containing protein [Streptomyces cinnamoneus]|uniref:DNA-binding protein n=1 Tax=Streptomyces cinnamoneus TaxID=53446 RepID=A0A918U355_STRCJ|nr:helix-turn-helix domain-containing protein [Streptomyces cinnamoneus]GHC70308.1 DNA-binding protein [Streptomyces cinnamoneus]